MKPILFLAALLLTLSLTSAAQDHGSVTFNGQTITFTGYRTRYSDQKRWIIAEGKKDGKLYSVTVTLTPDVTKESTIKTDATHTVTLTVSNLDYSAAQNHCFDGGSTVMVKPQGTQFTASGKDMQSGNCFGKSSGSDKLSFTMKP